MTAFTGSKLSQVLAREVIQPSDRSQLLPFSTTVYCPDYNGVKADKVTIIKPALTKNTDVASVTIDINLSESLDVTFPVPQSVDLKTDFDLMDIIKSHFAAEFKKAVSDKIHSILVTKLASIKKITVGDTLAATLGKVIADNIANGTGQRFSIYKYNNGAPVTYIQGSSQPPIDKAIDNEDNNMSYSSIDYPVPALHYFESPTVIIPNATFEEYQIGLCDGTIKRYVESKINVDTAKADYFTDLGEGVVGSNDCFAVAFTEPRIATEADRTKFRDLVTVHIDYGVELVNDTNLRILDSAEVSP